jgi:hypothetical protein
LKKGTVIQKEHWNDLEDIDLPEVARKAEPVEEIIVEENPLYLVDGSEYEKSYVDQIDPETIESVNVIKDTTIVREGSLNFNSIIEITLKKN